VAEIQFFNNADGLFSIEAIVSTNTSGTTTPDWGSLQGWTRDVDATIGGTTWEETIAYIPSHGGLQYVAMFDTTNASANYDFIAVFFNVISSSPISSAPCSSLPFPFNDICNAVTGFLSQITSIGQGLFGGLVYIAQSIYNFAVEFGQLLVNAFNAIGNWLWKGLSWIWSGLQALGTWIFSGVQWIVQHLVNFFNWLWRNIANGVSYLVNAINSGMDAIYKGIEGIFVNMQNTLVARLTEVVYATLVTPAELKIARGIFEGFVGGKMNTKRFLIGLGGIFVTPIIAQIVAQFITQILTLRQITQLFPRPQLPSIQLPFIPLQPPNLVLVPASASPVITISFTSAQQSSTTNSEIQINMGSSITSSLNNATLTGQLTTQVSTSVM